MTGRPAQPEPELTRSTSNPLHALGLAGHDARPNTARAQRERVLMRLQAGPATAAALARECYCPSPTKRVSELRRAGWPIRSAWIELREPDGTVSPATLYRLPADADPAQLSLPL